MADYDKNTIGVSKAGSAKNATPSNLQAFQASWEAIPYELRVKVWKTWPRDPAAKSMKVHSIVGYMEPLLMYGLTHDFGENASGYHWTHDNFDNTLNLLEDVNAPINERVRYAKYFASSPDLNERKNIRRLIMSLGVFSQKQLTEIFGEAPTQITRPQPKQNTVLTPAEQIAALASALGISPDVLKVAIELAQSDNTPKTDGGPVTVVQQADPPVVVAPNGMKIAAGIAPKKGNGKSVSGKGESVLS